MTDHWRSLIDLIIEPLWYSSFSHPTDLINLHVANGLDVNKFVDYAKLVSEGKLDGEKIQL